MSECVERYFEEIESKVNEIYKFANDAKKNSVDYSEVVEIPISKSLAEKSVNLVLTIYPNLPVDLISNRIVELEEEYGKLNTTVGFVIAREIADGKFVKFDNKLDGIDCGIRVAFSYITLGVVASPIEGYTGIRLGKTRDDKDYFIVNFSGPIRSAGTTATCVILMLIDYLRDYFGYAKYDATEDEISRYVVENTEYHERISNLQYFPTEEEIVFLAKNLPIQIDGDATTNKEVSNYKNLDRVSTNFIRGGMCLAFSEGLAQKAAKGLKRLGDVKKNGIEYNNWNFLNEYLEIHKKRESGDKEGVATYIKDLVAGRPVYGHPGRSGGFRFRYGSSRVNGFSSVSIHPGTMAISDGFLSNGTQLKLEKPIKGAIITSCDSIDGPIVKLKDNSVVRINSFDEGIRVSSDIKEIIYLGDMLFSLGDVIDRNHNLVRVGYVEEWWDLELQKKIEITGDKLDYDKWDVDFEFAKEVSRKYLIPLYPKFIFYWNEINVADFYWLMDWLQNGNITGDKNKKLLLPWSSFVRDKFKEGKRALELLGVCHKIVFDNVVIEKNEFEALFVNIGVDVIDFKLKVKNIINLKKDYENVLEIINEFSSFIIKDKSGSFIGSRMGRPEKAKLRKLAGSPNGLFCIGESGGRLKEIKEAVGKDVFVKFDRYVCDCGNETIYSFCEKCNNRTHQLFFCRECNKWSKDKCVLHNGSDNKLEKLDVKYYFEDCLKKLKLGSDLPFSVKGVEHCNGAIEYLGKGVLRAKYGLSVNKDGTIRYDATEVSLTHFKAKEIGCSVEKLRELGYVKDINGDEIVSDEQIVGIFPHDIILPSCSVSPDEKADDVFLNISKFVDEELIRVYNKSEFYNFRTKDDLIGQLVACMAPHNCAAVIGRIIGFTELQGIVASPFMHAAMRRDCDGDEASVMLLMDVLLNFSRSYLPKHRGGKQDAPLILNSKINAGEVDDQIVYFDIANKYPLELYELSEVEAHSSKVNVETIGSRISEDKCGFTNLGFTHDSNDFNDGVLNGSYKSIPSMKEKVEKQMELVEKIRAVDTDDVARLVIEKHFIRDIRGNLRKFSTQGFRCSSCGFKYRRPPLIGVCEKCSGKIIFTVSEGSIRKYLEPAMEMAKKYNVSSYIKEIMDVVKMYVENVFGITNEIQTSLYGNLDSKKKSDLIEVSEVVEVKKKVEKFSADLFGNKKILSEDKKEEIVKEEVIKIDTRKEIFIEDKNVVEGLGGDVENEGRKGFVHLHLHTEYSFLDGAIKVGDLFKRIKELGMDAVAITEHGNMQAMINKYQAAKKEGVKLIFGMEPYLVKDINVKDKNEKRIHLILLAENEEGYKNLIKLASIAGRDGFYYRPRLDKNILRKYSKGLICLSACIANDVAQSAIHNDFDKARGIALEYIDIFGKENFYLEIQNHNISEEEKVRKFYVKLGGELGVKLVATNDCHYLLKEDREAHEAMLCIQTNGSMEDINRFKFDGENFHITSEDEMREMFKDFPNVVSNSVEIADRCNVELKLGETIFPDFETPDNLSHKDYLSKLCFEMLEVKYGGKYNYDEAKKRLEYELSVINKMGFATYFLIVQDFIAAVKGKCQIGPGRGSGAGSIVAYLLGITQLEPLHLGLLFERFLNPDRISLPDFDIDFGNRDMVIEYVQNKYGHDKIALIGTYGTMSAKSVLKDVMRVYKIPFNVANEITDYVGEKTIKKSLDLKDEKGNLINQKLINFKNEYPKIFEIAQRLEGCVRHKGVHACGVVWGKKPIDEYFPIYKKDEFIVAQVDGGEVEDSGLVKFDFLGLETLNITHNVLNLIGKDNEWLENISLDDMNVYDMLREGNSLGVFQLESGGMQKTLRLVKPTCFDDIIAIVALYRPGPMQYLEVYARRKDGAEQVKYVHKNAEEILAPTYGIMVYQEQVMKLAQSLAGFTMAEADVLRKAIGKKKLDLMKKMESKFKEGCIGFSGMDKNDIDKLWNDIVKFAAYSFNKSHAAAYALIAYRTAYLRKYYPAEFIAATISANTNNPDKMTFYLDEARKMGVRVFGPDINLSDRNFSIENVRGDKCIRFGLKGIKNVGDGALKSILENRPYVSYQDFIGKVDLTKVNKRVLKNLISVGCFDNFSFNRGQLLSMYDKLKKGSSFNNKQMTLFSKQDSNESVCDVKDLSLKEKINLEKEVVGVCISCHPADLYREGKSNYFISYDKMEEGEDVEIFGIIKKLKIIKTKNGNDMAFMTLYDKKDECDAVVFAKVFDNCFRVGNFKEGDGVIVSGKYNINKERGNSVWVSEVKRAFEFGV